MLDDLGDLQECALLSIQHEQAELSRHRKPCRDSTAITAAAATATAASDGAIRGDPGG